MRNLVILEGPDGAGKTTLAEMICQEARKPATARNVLIRNHGAYPGMLNVAGQYLASIEAATEMRAPLVVMDRSWISEPIYGAAMRGGANRIKQLDAQYLEMKAREAGALLVFCLPPFEQCRRAWESRRTIEYVGDVDRLRQVYDGYCEAFDSVFRIQKVLYDWTLSDSQTLLNEVLR